MPNSSRAILGSPPATTIPDTELLTTGGEFLPRRERINNHAVVEPPSSGTLTLNYFTALRTEPITTLTVWTGSTAAAATPTLIRYGIYSAAANGDLTLAASTPNDTTLLAATFTAYPKALSASWSKVAGQRYAAALLVVTGAAMPVFLGFLSSATGIMSAVNLLGPARCHRLLTQTDLPSSIPAGSLTTGGQHQIAVRMS